MFPEHIDKWQGSFPTGIGVTRLLAHLSHFVYRDLQTIIVLAFLDLQCDKGRALPPAIQLGINFTTIGAFSDKIQGGEGSPTG